MAAPVRLSFLGGLGQIGRNCAVLETAGKLLLIDCGQMFPDDSAPGIDTILPDFTLLRERAADIVGCICTHGHEDHIGALPYLLRDVSFPVHATPFTLGLVRHKLVEAGLLDRADLVPIADHDRRNIGPFDCEFLPVTHSTPSGVISVIRTPQGVILHSSDLKIDPTPIDGRLTDLPRVAEIGRTEGVRLLLADSTNADQPGETRSESRIGEVLRGVFAASRGKRVTVASFASHIHRMQQVADIAVAEGRVIVPIGLSMVRNVKLARELGIMRIPDACIVDAEEIDRLPPELTCVICTGSQGEPRSALWQMVNGDNRYVDVGPDDVVLFSSHPIPGNEAAVARLRNGLARLGAEVVHSGQLEVHTSGHARQGELTIFHRAASPEWFVPVHGEHAHLFAHAKLARDIGMPPDHVLVCCDGDSLVITDHGVTRGEPVSGAEIYVDGAVGAVDGEVLRQRRVLGTGGFVSVVVTVDLATRRAEDPIVASRGWTTDTDRAQLHGAVADAVRSALRAALDVPRDAPRDDRDIDAITVEALERVVRRAAGSTVAE
ncbi:MAG TPA: ribonuclease J, partial [Acidimicrobiales bacterium]|nr:ribonuclease J [Acidimicrobiales bacterium]